MNADRIEHQPQESMKPPMDADERERNQTQNPIEAADERR